MKSTDIQSTATVLLSNDNIEELFTETWLTAKIDTGMYHDTIYLSQFLKTDDLTNNKSTKDGNKDTVYQNAGSPNDLSKS